MHNAVHSHTRLILPNSMVSFFYSAVLRKTTKHVFILDSLHYRIANSTQLCVYYYSCLSVAVWYYDIIKRFLDILLYFPYKTGEREWKLTWRSRVQWLANLVSYDITWKPPIEESWEDVQFAHTEIIMNCRYRYQ